MSDRAAEHGAFDDGSSRRFRRGFVLVLLVGIAVAFIGMVRDFLVALTLAAIFAWLLHPVTLRVRAAVGPRPALTATIVVLAAALAVGLPLAGLVTIVVAEAVEVSRTVGPYVRRALSEGITLPFDLPAWAEGLRSYQGEIVTRVGGFADAAAGGAVQSLTRATQGTVMFAVNLAVMLYAMFFFIKDGSTWMDGALDYLPLRQSARESILEKGLAIIRATVLSILVVGVVQGVLVGVALWLADVPGAAFWGALVVPLSAIPALGAPIVWVPAAVYLVLRDQLIAAVALAIWGAGVVGLVDNVLRARLVGAPTRMSDLLVLVSTLGGIGTLGPVGIVIGPVVAGLLLTMLDIYRETFREVLEPETPPSSGDA